MIPISADEVPEAEPASPERVVVDIERLGSE
jgi:hypothetical protein